VAGYYRSGGLIGCTYSGATVSHCYATGDVYSIYLAGGLSGSIDCPNTLVEKCYATGDIDGYQTIGGFTGSNYGAVIKDCYATGDVNGFMWVGGFQGLSCYHIVDGVYHYAETYTSYSTGRVSGYGYYGGFNGGFLGGGTVQDCYWDTQTSGMTTSYGGTGKTTSEMKRQATFVNWDFSSIWDITEEVTYPFLRPSNEPPVADAGLDQTVVISETVTLDGSGSTDPDGTIVSYDWDFDDSNTGTGVTTTHAYDTEGTYTVTLTVEDDAGATDTDTAIITVLTAEEAIWEINDYIQSLSDEAFVNNPAQHKNALYEKLIENEEGEAVLQLVEAGMYQEALEKLQNDIRSKCDGSVGGISANDWITDPEIQTELIAMIDPLIDYLGSLV
jgi:hypothetical protein